MANEKVHDVVVWSDKYKTGIKLIDKQHHTLVDLTNQLYLACRAGDDVLAVVFQDAMHKMVDYVRHHFTAELILLDKINYPDYQNHKRMHDDLIRDILNAAKEFNEGKKLTPNNFTRTLEDWVFGHIAVYDKMYAAYAADQKRKGVLSDKVLMEIETAIDDEGK
ncbi:MAG: bacteriohemerythrin [Treponema sp.]|nr:bacteriohemerythrin [Treponema sp.]MCL2271538.1 bacteriohemerythrin [Treponema sp.]